MRVIDSALILGVFHMTNSKQAVLNAWKAGLMIPSFNAPYLPMIEPTIRAIIDADAFAFIAVARLEWTKFEAKGLGPVIEEYKKWAKPEYTRLHLDHVPVIDEDQKTVDYENILSEAASLGYDSLMIDASRLDLNGNIAATRKAVEIAHKAGIPCEAELGAVLGHEAGPPPPYEEIFQSGKGFTDVEEAHKFVRESGCDWLSVAIGNVHGAVSGALKDQKKVAARLNIDHLKKLRDATGLPLVLHGGSGIQIAYVLESIRNGIAKMNIGTEIRQPYEIAIRETGSVEAAQEATYKRTFELLKSELLLAGTRNTILGQ
jgi:ketose-bisphosphate aldolase